jgi:hypothetical protein
VSNGTYKTSDGDVAVSVRQEKFRKSKVAQVEA